MANGRIWQTINGNEMIELLFIVPLSVLVAFYSGYYLFGLRYGKNIRYGSSETCMPRVSLVIATYNEEDIIGKKIENILEIDYPKDKLELVFVDSSTDNTLQIIKNFKEESGLNIQILEEKVRRGLASALNLGYKSAKGDVVIKTDCDMFLEKNSVKEIVKFFSDPQVGAVTGKVVISNESNVEIGYRNIFERLRIAEANLDSTYLFNPFCAFRKDLIEPIDSRSVADDAELALKIRKKGCKTVYSPNAIAYEASPTSLKGRISQKSRRAQGHIRLIFQNLGFLFNPKFGRFGMIVFPANFFMMVLSPWLILLTMIFAMLFLGFTFGLFYAILFVTLVVLLTSLVYLKSTPKMVAGFLDAQINLLVGFFKLATKGPDFMWSKEHRQ
jgi:cellulose synthase/poly-beta-1,6-N-acetylglucosamine synthase-like glycosyltransferase